MPASTAKSISAIVASPRSPTVAPTEMARLGGFGTGRNRNSQSPERPRRRRLSGRRDDESYDASILTTATGKPFTAAGFGNWFRKRCNEAGLPQCSAHGLTDEEMMAWTGHKTRSQLTIYSRGASQKRGAMAGATKLVVSSESEQIAAKPPEGIVKP